MVGEIGTALTSLKVAFDMARAISDIAKTADIQSAVIGLQRQILDAQQAALSARDRETALQDEIAALRNEIGAFNSWQREKDRYQLEVLPPGFSVYGLRDQAGGAEPEHKLCAVCFNQDRKTILNSRPFNGQTAWECGVCKTTEYSGQRNQTRVRPGPSDG